MPARPCPHCGWTIKYATKRCQRCVKPLPKEFQELPEPPPPPAAPASTPVQHASPASVNAKTARHPLMGALQFFKRLFGFNSAGGHYEAALRHEEKRDHDKAIAELTEAIRLDPEHADAYYARGLLYGIRKDWDSALTDLKMVLQLQPNAMASLGATEDNSGLVLTQREPVKVGWPLLKLAVEQDLAGVYQNRGFALYAANCFDKAITEFSESIRLVRAWHTYYERGRAYFHSGRFNEALDDFRRAINLSPENPDLEGFPAGAHYFLGCCYLENSEFGNAISELTTSIQLAPHAYCSYEDRAKAYRALGDEAHAREDDNRARELRGQGRG